MEETTHKRSYQVSEEGLARLKEAGSKGGKATVKNRSPEAWATHLKKMLEGRNEAKRKRKDAS